MESKLFMDPACKPAQASLESALGSVYPQYQNLLILSDKFLQDWNFSKSGGWMLKVHAIYTPACCIIFLSIDVFKNGGFDYR